MAQVLLSALSARRGGGRTYLRNIVSQFPADAGHRLSIISAFPLDEFADIAGVACIAAPRWAANAVTRALFGAVYFRFFWPQRRAFDAVYFAGGSFDIALPPGPKRIVAFRNMIPFDMSVRRRYRWFEWERLRNWLLRRTQVRAFRRAELVVFISEFAKRVIDAEVTDRRGRSVVIPHGIDETQGCLDDTLAARLPDQFVLYLSILDVYKAQVELIAAWAMLRKMRPTSEKLVLAGPEYAPYAARVRAAILENDLQDEVLMLGAVPHDAVFDLTKRATLNLFLSTCENCPNIMLELMRAGPPVVASSYQPMPEFGGDALDYVDPYDPAKVAAMIARYLDDPALRLRRGSDAQQRSQRFDWTITGRRTWDAITAEGEGNTFATVPRSGRMLNEGRS